MLTEIILLVLVMVVAVLIYFLRSARNDKNTAIVRNETDAPPLGCCGKHADCIQRKISEERRKQIIEYFDDEELDHFANRDPETYTEKEIVAFDDVYTTLRSEERLDWYRSLLLRHIAPPSHIHEELSCLIHNKVS